MPGRLQGQLLLPSQIPALTAQTRADQAQVYEKGRMARSSSDDDRYELIQDRGDRLSGGSVYLRSNGELWAGREVLLQRVLSAAGTGLPPKDLAAVVIHGHYNFGSRWEKDVRLLLRDGTFYNRTDMPPDQLNVAASRQLEPQRWGRWRAAGKAYDMQPQDSDGRGGEWQAEQHRAVKPWPDGTRLEGHYSRNRFDGSQFSGGISSTQAIRFTRDGRFERSYHSPGTSGSIAAAAGTMVSGAAYGDGQGSTTTGGGTVAGGLGTTTTTTQGSRDDGHQERLLSFPVRDDRRSIFVADGSYDLDKDK